MIRAGVDGDAWTGGTVRLAGSDLIGGQPAMNITGIAFHPADIQRLAFQQRPTPQPSRKTKSPPATMPLSEAHAGSFPAPQRRPKADLNGLRSGALLLTVKEAEAALGMSHTTIYKLINTGKLECPEGETRITAESVRRYAGLSG